MKRFIAVILLINICLFAFAGCGEKKEIQYEISDVSYFIWEESLLLSTKYCQAGVSIKNTGEIPIDLNICKFSVLDNENLEIHEIIAYDIFPSILQPNETGYIFRREILNEAIPLDKISQITVKELNVFEHKANRESYPVNEHEIIGESKNPIVKATGRITNNTGEDVNLYIGVVLLGKDDKILGLITKVSSTAVKKNQKPFIEIGEFNLPDNITYEDINQSKAFANIANK